MFLVLLFVSLPGRVSTGCPYNPLLCTSRAAAGPSGEILKYMNKTAGFITAQPIGNA
jgi:hypothetical protein